MAKSESVPADPVGPSFLIAHGGPFYELQERLGLLHANALNAGRRAALAVALAWGVPLVLAALAGHLWGGPAGSRPFLLDFGAWARFFIVIGVLVLSERQVEQHLRQIQGQFLRAPLLAPSARPGAADAVLRSLRRRDSRLAELIILAVALLIALLSVQTRLTGELPAWLAQPDGTGALRLTLAGWWTVMVSLPLFWFLVLRWLWRHLVWALLLHDLANLELRLVATHPDGYGGLGFVGDYPNAFASFVFAMTCVIAAAALQALLHGNLTGTTFPYAMAVWLVLVVILFAFPLAAFGRPLKQLKRASLLAYAAAATRKERENERDALGRNVAASDAADSEEHSLGGDPTKTYAAVRKLGTLPVTKAALLPLGVAAVLPLLAVGATQLPFKELLKVAKLLLL